MSPSSSHSKPRWIRAALVALSLAALGAGGVFVACSSDPITQTKLIGEPCTSDSDCGTPPWFSCLSDLPGGYCTKSCKNDADCPPEGICAFTDSIGTCSRRCTQTKDCRSPNYFCHPLSDDTDQFASHAYCAKMSGVTTGDGGSSGGDGGSGADM